MDPRLECPDLFRDFRFGFLYAIHAELNSALPNDFAASLDRRIVVWPSNLENELVDDAKIVAAANSAVNELNPPFVRTFSQDRVSGEFFLRIHHLQSGRDVAVIEMLSAERKQPGRERERYLWKRNDILGAQANLIEIDLLRAGERTPIGDVEKRSSDYRILVSDKSAFPAAKLWLMSIREALPIVPVPLDDFEEPISLNLQKCMDRAFDEGAFVKKRIDRRRIDPPLAEPDATWARELLAARTNPT
jgi:hypothetical protein